MQRKIEEALVKWKNSENRKPLIILGARQVGKTYTIKEFGKKYYKNIIYIDFEAYPKMAKLFEDDISPETLISNLQRECQETIYPKDTLIIFDEVQNCERALTSLKYFNEMANEYHVIAAGSLLGNALNRGHYSFPVGKVDMMNMYPLNFMEFLMASDRNDLVDLIRESYKNNTPVNSLIHDLIFKYYYTYLEVGGLPEAVDTYLRTKDMDAVHDVHRKIITSYRHDMTQYVTKNDAIKIEAIYDCIPSQLARPNKKFIYSSALPNGHASNLRVSLHWLTEAGITYECDRINEVKYPLKPYEDVSSFKLYYSDVGLYLSLIGISIEKTSLSLISNEIRGGISETYVMSELVSLGLHPYYWESHGVAEIDFIIQKDDMIIPLEVKSKDNNQSKSMKVYSKIYTPKLMVRVGTTNFGYTNEIKTIPLYAVWCLGE